MARKPSAPPPARALEGEDLARAVKTLERRIVELKTFDISEIAERFDARVKALEQKIASSLADIFGEGTIELRRHSIGPLESIPIVMGGPFGVNRQYPPTYIQENIRGNISRAVTTLESLKELLEERLEESGGSVAPHAAPIPRPVGRKVFIVHGRDEATKQAVARFISQLGLSPEILHEQSNGGRTIIEKLERNLESDFAVVLLTPDDVGGLAGEVGKPRARQNVILELGLFIGALGRNRVCPLYKGNVELPSDYDGVTYVEMDPGEGWKLKLAREIKQAGLDVDMNRIFG